MQATPKGLRLHIGIFGRRNVGKSSLLNAITQQSVSIVSPLAGTTTDPVEKPMELLPIGPVLFIDTAGLDELPNDELGQLRISKTRAVFDRTDLAILVTNGHWGIFELSILETLQQRATPVIVVCTKADQAPPPSLLTSQLSSLNLPLVAVSSVTGDGLTALREAILDAVPGEFIAQQKIVGDLVGPGGLVVLVVPIDDAAPKGRLILPQVQVIRDLLDSNALCLVVKENELPAALARLKDKPDLVITDSQAFLQVAAVTPAEIPLTSFSILFSRFKGDLATQAVGAMTVDRLKDGDRVLIAEACTHHPGGEDIARVKIPRWLTQYTGRTLEFTAIAGKELPADLADYQLVIHCGACTFNRKLMLQRILQCSECGVPITNFGMVIAWSLGIFERALGVFPGVVEACGLAKPSN